MDIKTACGKNGGGCASFQPENVEEIIGERNAEI